MTILIFYVFAISALLIGTAAIYMALIERFPVSWLYYHYFLRKPVNWSIFLLLVAWSLQVYWTQGAFPIWSLGPLFLSMLALILTNRMHQETAFPAVDFPPLTDDIESLPIRDEMQLAVIEYEGVTKCYPLDYVIHHHIINDKFGSKTVALTYCAMCRSIIPFDVTELGPLFVGSFKNANMIVADRKTKTFYQQATFKSIIGKRHSDELQMIPFNIMTWSELKSNLEKPQVVKVTQRDFREFQLPIPGIWRKITASESTPGLSSKNRDKRFPARTHVIGVIDASLGESPVFLKEEVLQHKIVPYPKGDFFLVGTGDSVNAFRCSAGLDMEGISFEQGTLLHSKSENRWDLRGKHRSGPADEDLHPVAVSDEYWFSWLKFHPESELIRV